MKLGISGQALGDVRSFREIVKLGKTLGVENFEIWPCNAGVSNDYGEADPEDMKQLLREEGVKIDCVTLGAAFDKNCCQTPEQYSALLTHAVEFASAVGAGLVNHYCYWISLSDQPDLAKMEAYWASSLKLAEKLGVCLVLENEAHDSTCTPQGMRKIMEHFENPCFKTNYDAVNYFHASCEGFPEAYEVLRPYIGYVHLKNGCLYREGAGQPKDHRGAPMSGLHAPTPIQYTPIPQGAVNIPGLLSRLEADQSYTGTCTLEPHTTPEHVEEFYRIETEWLRKLGYFTNH